MYVNPNNRHNDPDEIRAFVQQNNFGILTSQVEGRLWATHVPFMVGQNEKGQTILSTHIARANPQWRNLEGQEVMVIFNGPNAYISSSWYDHENVPTWNYLAVHAYGTVQILEGDALVQAISQLVNHHEQHSERPVSVEGMTPEFFKRELRALVGIEIIVAEFQSVRKLSQNRDDVNHNQITQQLQQRGDASSVAVATEMNHERSHATH